MPYARQTVLRTSEELKIRRYQWMVLSNTTLGIFMAALNSSIVVIALPAIFRGIGLNPLGPGNIGFLLWLLLSFSVALAVLVVSFGRLGDIVGRVRLYNLGFLIFTLGSAALALTPGKGSSAAFFMIGMRLVQGIGGAFLFANANAILADTFPSSKRGMALGINQVAALTGSFLGLVVGGILADVDWRLIFWISVPFGLFGTVWAFLKLKETSPVKHTKVDYIGSGLFAVGIILVLLGITYGIQPSGSSAMSWGTPRIIGLLLAGAAFLVLFVLVELRLKEPMLTLALFKSRAFASGNAANLLASIGRGGLQFMLILWLQGIWLPLHGYSFSQTPLWAGIYMLPLTGGFLISGPISGVLSDRYGPRIFSTLGMLLASTSFIFLVLLPVNFSYYVFAPILALNGIGFGLFSAPNSSAVMNSVPSKFRGTASGVLSTLNNTGQVFSIGIFFSLMITGLSASLPSSLLAALSKAGLPIAKAQAIAHLPAVASLFGAFLGLNPVKTLLGSELSQLPSKTASTLTSSHYFPSVIAGSFKHGISIAFTTASILCLLAAFASVARGRHFVHHESDLVVEPT